jgi:hypothetical protein
MAAELYTFQEDVIKREIKVVNHGNLASIAYINQRPIYLQQNEHYSWDIKGTKPVNEYLAFDFHSFFQISLNPLAVWRA